MRTISAKFAVAMCCALGVVTSVQAQAKDQKNSGNKQVLWDKLASDIREIDRNLDGVMGVAIEDLTTGQTFFVYEDEVFPQASSIKISGLAELYHQAQLSAEGVSSKAKLTDLYTVEAKDLVQDSDIMLGPLG